MKSVLVFLFFCLFTVCLFPNPRDTVWTKKLSAPISRVQFSPSGKYLAVHSDSIYFFDPVSAQLLFTFPPPCNKLYFFNDEKEVLLYRDSSIVVIDLATRNIVRRFETDTLVASIADISPDERFCVTLIRIVGNEVGYRAGWKLWDMQTGNIIREVKYGAEVNLIGINVKQVNFMCNSDSVMAFIARGYRQGSQDVEIDSRTTYSLLTMDSAVVEGYASWFTPSSNCRYLALPQLSSDSGVVIVGRSSNQILGIIHTNGYTITGMEFTKDEKYLVVTNTVQDEIKVWDFVKGNVAWSDGGTSYEGLSVSPTNLIATFVDRYLFLYKPPILQTSIFQDYVPPDVLFPNPATLVLDAQVEFPKAGSAASSIYMMSGQLIQSQVHDVMAGSNILHIPLNKIPIGSYLLRIQSGSVRKSFSFSITN